MNKDEIKMIEEMAKLLCDLEECCNTNGCSYYDEDEKEHLCQYFYKYKNGYYGCVEYATAEALYNAGYRRVEDDEMVIKKSEYEALLLEQKRLKEIVDRIPCGYVKIADDEIVESMKTYERARQETAREIIATIKEDEVADLNKIAQKYDIELED